MATLLNAMREAGVIADYALFGAAAQMRYTPETVAKLAECHGLAEAWARFQRRFLDVP